MSLPQLAFLSRLHLLSESAKYLILSLAFLTTTVMAADFGGLWEKTKEVAADSYEEAKDYAAEKKAEYERQQARNERYIELCIDAGGKPEKCKENFGGITDGFE